jgi:aryl-alcohol dehydrogenase-like predicted oxidoreductase
LNSCDAVEAGINFFDIADVYSAGVSEQVAGRVLAQVFTSRDEYVLAIKVTTWPSDEEIKRLESRTGRIRSSDTSRVADHRPGSSRSISLVPLWKGRSRDQ